MYYKTRIVFLCVSIFVFAGACLNFKQPPNQIQRYVLEYDSPAIVDLTPLPAAIKVERFSISPVYNSNRIIYRENSFKRDEYSYHKWRANPADMVTDFLSRDIRNSGLFTAVLPHGSNFPHSCILEGSVDEFVEWDTPEGWKAVLTVTVAMMAANEPDISKRILFQKTYRVEKPFTDKTPQGLVQAMSMAMEDISVNVIRDVYTVLKNRI